jgi:signal transduction histidine kinase
MPDNITLAEERLLILSTQAASTERVDVLNELAYELRSIDADKARQYLEKAFQEAAALRYTAGTAWALHTQGYFSWFHDKYAQALEYLSEAESFFEMLGHQRGLASTLRLIGLTYLRTQIYSTAVHYFLQSIAIAEGIGWYEGVVLSLNNVGGLYTDLENYDLARTHLQRAADYHHHIESPREKATTLWYLGRVQMMQRQYDAALHTLLECLELRKQAGDVLGLGGTIFSLGEVYLAKGELHRALRQYFRLLVLAERSFAKQGLPDSLKAVVFYGIGSIFTLAQKAERAIPYLNDAATSAQASRNMDFLGKAHADLSICHKYLHNFEQALYHAERAREVEISALKSKLQQTTGFLEYGFELERTRKETESERTRNAELAQLNTKLTELNEQKNRFIGIAAHDLRSPLATIQLGLDMMEFMGGEMSTERRAQTLHTMRDRIDYMKRLIDDFLSVSAIESGTLDLQCLPTNVTTFVQAIVDAVQPIAEQKQIHLTFDDHAPHAIALLDPQRFEQVMSNLLINAVKFSHSNTTIRVSTQCVPCTKYPERTVARFCVQDEGQGIPQEELSRVFEPFVKTSVKATAGEKSTGLGLAISKKLVEAHNGTISVESTVGKGTTFIIDMPLTDEHQHYPSD